MAPAALVMVLALAYPLAQSIWLSFHQWAIGAPLDQARFIGLENYRILLADPNVWASIRVTLVFAFAVVVIEVALGVALALVLDRQIRGMSLFRTIFILPMMVAPIVVGLVWRYLYNEQFGPFTSMLKALGLPTIPWLSSPDMALISSSSPMSGNGRPSSSSSRWLRCSRCRPPPSRPRGSTARRAGRRSSTSSCRSCSP